MKLYQSKVDSAGRSGGSGAGRVSEAQQILSRYTHDEQRIILHNIETVAGMSKYIGQDFQMKVLLNKPGGGWHWNFERNEVRVDPETLLKAPLDVSKAIYCHEGFHRRITPKDGVPKAEWGEPGLPFLVNSIEDPRIENFGGEAYPAYRPLRDASYRHHAKEAQGIAAEKLGRIPKHIRAGLELINQWFLEAEEKPFEIPDSLDPAVKGFVSTVLKDAQDAWWRYPSCSEVDWEPEKVKSYFQDAYKIIREKVWPEFKKLYEQDRQEGLLDEAMRELQDKQSGNLQQGQEGSSPQSGSPEPLSEQEVRELLKAAKEGKVKPSEGNSEGARPLELSHLPPDLQQEVADYVKSLPKGTQCELQERADARLGEASKEAAEALEGKAAQQERATAGGERSPIATERGPSPTAEQDDFKGVDLSELRQHVTIPKEDIDKIREEFAHLINEDRGLYHNTVREIASTINQLENDLRTIFQKRRQSHRESGRRSGPTLNIGRFIRERASGVPAVESRAFEAKTRPLAKDYAVLILVDVSGSMRDKIHHAFAATVACTEALSRLKIEHSILGFNEKLHTYKGFQDEADPARLETIEQEVYTSSAQYNNDGWALQQAAKQLSAAPQKKHILIVLSDGLPVPSSKFSGEKYDLKNIASNIELGKKIHLIGLGMGPGTEHVDKFYTNSRANIPIEDLPYELSTVIREAILR